MFQFDSAACFTYALQTSACVRPCSCRGKLLNVRDASVTQINGNAEINAIKQILGLQHGKARPQGKPGMQLEMSLSCSCKHTCIPASSPNNYSA